ncbi:hypothetical protein EIK77_005995 [Talaromyces pinophilus]|nr:hypothetical protein EIK77_005995 [Talaromyces pinophilus]
MSTKQIIALFGLMALTYSLPINEDPVSTIPDDGVAKRSEDDASFVNYYVHKYAEDGVDKRSKDDASFVNYYVHKYAEDGVENAL